MSHISPATSRASQFHLVALQNASVTQVTVGTDLVQLDTAKVSGRVSIAVKARAANTGLVFVGFDSGTSVSNAWELSARDAVELDVNADVDIWAIGSAAGQNVCVIQVGG